MVEQLLLPCDLLIPLRQAALELIDLALQGNQRDRVLRILTACRVEPLLRSFEIGLTRG